MHCTKLKVYRPQSCNILPKPSDSALEHLLPPDQLTATMEKVKPMDMAIRWDYRLPHEKRTPRTSIDPTNTSAAFNLIKHSAPSTERSAHVEHPGGVFANTNGEEGFFERDIMRRNKDYFSSKLERETHRFCQCKSLTANRVLSAERRSQMPQKVYRCNSSPNVATKVNVTKIPELRKDFARRPKTSKLDSTESRIRTFHYSEKVLRNGSEMDRMDLLKYECKTRCNEPQSDSSGVHSGRRCCSSEISSKGQANKSAPFIAPKPRQPYAKKNYVIDTLAPPFSCWRGGAGQGGYPDFWRLSSVYQQAYKPIHQRKRPLLETVYK